MMLYDITQPFEYNVTYGPFWEQKIPTVPRVASLKTTLFDTELNSPFGVSACPLTHGSRAVKVMSQLGYDIITYRSVRSMEWHGQPYPHWRYVDIKHQLTMKQISELNVLGSEEPFSNQAVSTANSLGIQSLKPEYWQTDVEVALRSIKKGQLLILSIMFTPEAGNEVVRDAEAVAQYANETSVQVFEINLAHPNSGMKSLVYEDIATSVAICKAIKKVIGHKHLVAKVGYYKDQSLLEDFMKQTVGVIDGISSTNTYAMSIVDSKGGEVFPNRPKAGVAGEAIRTLSQQQAEAIIKFKKKHQLRDLAVVGIGGVTAIEHIDQYLSLGVNAVQSATGVFANPLLAIVWKKNKNR